MTTNDNDEDQGAHLERLHSELNQSLQRCRGLLDTHRSQLAANSNEPEASQEGGDGAA